MLETCSCTSASTEWGTGKAILEDHHIIWKKLSLSHFFSECEVELDTIFNSSVHLSFQVDNLVDLALIPNHVAEPKEHPGDLEDERRRADACACLPERAPEESDGS